MKILAAAVLIGSVLVFAGVAAPEESRVDRAVREAKELQAQQERNSGADRWLQSKDGQHWGKTFHSTPQEPMTVVGPPQDVTPILKLREAAEAWPRDVARCTAIAKGSGTEFDSFDAYVSGPGRVQMVGTPRPRFAFTKCMTELGHSLE